MELFVANLTPFDSRRKVDVGALRAHVLWMYANGVNGFAPTGTTGEFLYLDWREKAEIHRVVIDAAPGRKVMPCVWDSNLAASVKLAKAAADHGAWAVFLPPPIYHPVTERAILMWYSGIRRAVDIPVYAYHHPRTHNPIGPELLAKLIDAIGLSGMKDSSGDPLRVKRMSKANPDSIWVGGDMMLSHAGELPEAAGFISRMGNLYPELAMRLVHEWNRELQDALELRHRLIREAGGIPAMKEVLGFHSRLPLVGVNKEYAEQLPETTMPR